MHDGTMTELTPSGPRPKPIAIVGMSGRFPDADDVDAFWKNIRAGRDSVGEAPTDRGWDIEDYFSAKAQTRGKTYARHGGFLKDIDRFDPLFFEIAPNTVEIMDPSARLFLEEAWRAIEDAGYSSASLGGARCGMYYCAKGDYANLVQRYEQTYLASTDTYTPARLAYHLNLVGPAFSLDTACSSTLAAVAHACDALTLGNCEVAIVGGGGLNATPNALVTSSQMLLYSPTGRCRTFDAEADGTVLGEAIGALVLKPLARAEADGDHIYGVIRGWGTNQDGRTNGLTAPSAKSQVRLQTEIYERFGIDPADIGMVEAHGTGTRLGDPIEVQALTESFRRFTDGRGYCALGSVKTNIGHAFFGAGVTAVIKVLQSIRHREIPASLHFETINPAIKIDDSPFFVNTELRSWDPPLDRPRCAAINAFGATGINAHVVIEEYRAEPWPTAVVPPPEAPTGPVAIVLSAKSAERLQAQAERLLAALRAPDGAPPRACDLAYTLQVGRDAMSERLAFVAGDLDEAAAKLAAFLRGEGAAAGVHRGAVPAGAIARMEAAAALRDETARALEARDLESLASFWAAGAIVDWSRLYAPLDGGDGMYRPQRVRLPTYPFAGERYWIGRGQSVVTAPASLGPPNLHPLLHANVSNLDEHCYASTFSGEEFFLRDHKIQGAKLLPGVAYLEMARAAVTRSLGELGLAPQGGLRLENIVWMQPFVFGPESRTVRTAVGRAEGGRVEFEVYRGEAAASEVARHFQGEASLEPPPAAPPLDIAALRAACTRYDIGGGQLYPKLWESGFMLGPAHRGVVRLYVGEGQVLAELALPHEAPAAGFTLHPSLLDSALQAAAGLLLGAQQKDASVPLPFALAALNIHAPCPPRMWAWVRYAAGGAPGEKVVRTDIDLCDAQGRVCVQLQGLASRGSQRTAPAPAAEAPETLLLRPEWRAAPEAADAPPPETLERYIVFCAAPDRLGAADALELRPGVRGVLRVAVGGLDTAADFEVAAQSSLIALKGALHELAGRGRERAPLVVQLVADAGAGPEMEGLAGLARSAAQENSQLGAQLVLVSGEAADLGDRLDRLAATLASGAFRLDGERVLTREPAHIEADDAAGDPPWRAGGVYLIAGGLGGLGLILAGEIAACAPGATLILAGRKAPGPVATPAIAALASSGCRVVTREVDLCDRTAADDLAEAIGREFGGLTGVVHCAGVVRDNYLVNKASAELAEVLAPKVRGLVNLDGATARFDLELFVGFSSLAGAWGNAGQGDYAAANGFMDAYLARRQARVDAGLAKGRSLSVGWPLWRDGGMQIDEAYRKAMASRSGLEPLPTDEGLQALRRALAGADPHVLVVHARRRQLAAQPARPAPSRAQPAGDPPALAARAEDLIRGLIADLIKVDPARIDVRAELSEFGLDSISLTQLSNTLNEAHGIGLSPTIFFEYSTIRDFAGHLAEIFEDELQAVFAAAGPEAATLPPPASAEPDRAAPAEVAPPAVAVESPAPSAIAAEAQLSRPRLRGRYGGPTAEEGAKATDGTKAAPVVPAPATSAAPPEPIAVIGVSAQFPMANDLGAFWRNLVEGRDCITEIPPDRWDWRAIHGDPVAGVGVTNIKWGGFIDGVGDWDPAFFSISPREAELIDPQKRLLMTHVWKAIEDAGYAPGDLAGSNTALYVGTADSGYANLYAKAGVKADGSGTPASMGPNRMSYFLDLHGPSEPVETACSSSLVAIHRGAAALREGTSDLAVVGGVQTIPTEHKHISFSQGGVLSEDGRCKTFSSGANGYVRAEGVGMLVLKRLSDAQRDGDAIYGVILASAENHGGRANSLTSPNPRAQAQLLVSAYRKAQVDPETVGYIEAHGTGTMLGDPIEINALKAAFRELRPDDADGPPPVHCGLGSVKSNIGHTELAAGVAGVIKVLLQMRHRTLVKSLHCETLNPHIDLSGSPFEIVRETRPWAAPVDREGRPARRRAGVSSFGVGGVNAHVVLEEYA